MSVIQITVTAVKITMSYGNNLDIKNVFKKILMIFILIITSFTT